MISGVDGGPAVGVEKRRGEERAKGDWDNDIVGIWGKIIGEAGRFFSSICKSRLFSQKVFSEVEEKREKSEGMMRRDAFFF